MKNIVKLSMIKKIVLIPIIILALLAIDFFITGEFYYHGTRHHIPFIAYLLGGLALYYAYILWDNASAIKDFTKSYKIKDPVYNLDRIDINDKDWIANIRKEKGKKKFAYSKKGIKEAKDKAKLLTVEDCFLFISYRDVR